MSSSVITRHCSRCGRTAEGRLLPESPSMLELTCQNCQLVEVVAFRTSGAVVTITGTTEVKGNADDQR